MAVEPIEDLVRLTLETDRYFVRTNERFRTEGKGVGYSDLDLLAVRINPENGDREREIAEYYGITGYPGFFVHSGSSRTLSRVDRMLVEAGQPRLMVPQEFIAACQKAGSR